MSSSNELYVAIEMRLLDAVPNARQQVESARGGSASPIVQYIYSHMKMLQAMLMQNCCRNWV